MAEYSFSDLERMQNEAARRVQRMEQMSRERVQEGPLEPSPEPEEVEKQTETDSQPPTKKKRNVLEGERGIIILPILLLAGDEKNEMVVLALLYTLL